MLLSLPTEAADLCSFPHRLQEWTSRVCATALENPIITYRQKYPASEDISAVS